MAKKKKRERVYGTQPAGTAPRASSEPGSAAQGPVEKLWEGVKSLVVALALFLVLRSFVIQNFVITSGSMEQTLLVGDFLMVNRLAMGGRLPFTQTNLPGYAEPAPFDVIVFDPPHEENLKLVKRLMGMPGDTLRMVNKVMFINGKAIEEPWVQHVDRGDQVDPRMDWQKDYLVHGEDPAAYRPTRDNWGPLVVPEGNYFMLGDNRDTSLDSRYWGLLERWRVEGRAVFIYFSYNKGSYRPFAFLREIRWDRIGQGID
jgi:signal peptidase I